MALNWKFFYYYFLWPLWWNHGIKHCAGHVKPLWILFYDFHVSYEEFNVPLGIEGVYLMLWSPLQLSGWSLKCTVFLKVLVFGFTGFPWPFFLSAISQTKLDTWTHVTLCLYWQKTSMTTLSIWKYTKTSIQHTGNIS